jgi:hypothetical protein
VPVGHHCDLAGPERLVQGGPVPARAARVRDVEQLVVEGRRLDGLGLVEQGGTGVLGPDLPHLLPVLEVIAAVGPQDVREVAHQ